MKGINWLGVVVALIVGQAIGMAWYGMAFSDEWMALSGITETGDEGSMPMILGAVNQLVAIIGLGWAASRLGVTDFVGGAKIGLFAAVFFAATTHAQRFIYAGEPTGLIPIDVGYTVVTYVLMGAIVAGVRLKSKAAAAA